MSKKKLTISEQIEDMHKKGITFHFTNEKDACKFLKHNNYYFKLKSYGKNYDKYLTTAKKGQYINLDFSYLQELSILDMYLRKSIISMALDIENTTIIWLEIQFEISKIKTISQNAKDKWMANPVIHDFVILVFVFVKLIKSVGIKQSRINNLHWLFNERMLKHKEYFLHFFR